ncbi:MAG: AMP-binding protein [Acidiferrobacterales bacterium]|nr:AMP-binding protein [Acidiferrobacterales bacterium]
MQEIKTLGDYVESTMARYRGLPAFQCGEHCISFDELEEKSRALGCWLQSTLQQGDRVVVQLPNIIQYPIAAMAILRAGMVLVNTNPLYTPREMAHQFKDSGAKAIIILSTILPNLEQIVESTDLTQIITVEPQDLRVEPAKQSRQGHHRLYDILNTDTVGQLEARIRNTPEEIVLLQYTGGTTGVAKGACLTHNNILSNVLQVKNCLRNVCKEREEIFICPLPLYHIYAFTVNMIYMFGLGNLNVLIANPRDLDAFIEQISKLAFTGMSGINTLFVGLCNHASFKHLDFSHLKLTLSGGASLLPEVANKWAITTGATITEGYGLTETSPVVAFNEPGNEEIGTIGKPVSNTVVDIRDANGERVKTGQAGELIVKGPQVMSAYWQRPEATKEVFTSDGFFKTGDIAIQNENGSLRIVDRLKDMILVSGFNVYPNEIEEVLSAHPQVLEAAVVGSTCSKTGEQVLAYVTVVSEVSEQQLLAYCRENLTAYKVPKSISVLDELPKSTVGKVLRKDLRALQEKG